MPVWDVSFSLREDETLSLCGRKEEGPNAWWWVSKEEPGRTVKGGAGTQACLEIHTQGAWPCLRFVSPAMAPQDGEVPDPLNAGRWTGRARLELGGALP